MHEITVDVVYALPEHQYVISVAVAPQSTVRQAIMASGLLEIRRDIDLGKNKVGIYGRVVTLEDSVQAGCRIEIYRPLMTDPKELRRQRAQRVKK
jgi:putative ubiquitin-RnfH superfamily antitoxin RatB of RatAB toxin-antitoxin module